jgi:phospholipid/cholesterol/gamma-HCH transport system ATP-binding protein
MSSTPTIPGPPAVAMREVTVGALRRSGVVVAEDVNWAVAPGDYWVVAAPQGSGKSDFLQLTAGLMPPAAGRYEFFGGEMPIYEEDRLPQRLRLGLVFDGGQLFNQLTVAENVALPWRYHRNLSPAEAEPDVRRMLAWTGLTDWAEHTPGALARSWQKRVGLARALMLRPEVLLVDNPLAGLDLRHRGWWLDFLGQLSRGEEPVAGRPVTLVVTADDLRPWRNRARQFAVLKDRRLVVLGGREQLEAAGDELVRELLAASTPGD